MVDGVFDLVNNNKNIVCIGGGTGISTMLRGLKQYEGNLTAIVAVSDNGGSSGILRRELNMLPPGDIRNCLLALADTEPLMKDVLNYRFEGGSLEGQNFGNLFIAALTGVFGSFEIAVEKANDILAVKGKVLPVTTEDIHLCAELEDHSIVEGECEIVLSSKKSRKKIKHVFFKPENPTAYYKSVEAIEKADIIIIGPGSLYTSIVPNLLIKGIREGIKQSKAKVIYIGNIMTQPGETDGYSLMNHLNVIEEYLGENTIDYVIVNDESISSSVLGNYQEDGAEQVINDAPKHMQSKILRYPLIKISKEERYIRHDHLMLGKIIMSLKILERM